MKVYQRFLSEKTWHLLSPALLEYTLQFTNKKIANVAGGVKHHRAIDLVKVGEYIRYGVEEN